MHKKNIITICFPALVLIFLAGCELPVTESSADTSMDLTTLTIPPDFNFETKRDVFFQLKLEDNLGMGLRGVMVSAYTGPENGERLFSRLSDAKGKIELHHPVPASLDRITLRTEYLGLPNALTVPIEQDRVVLDLRNPEALIETQPDLNRIAVTSVPYTIGSLGSYDGSGHPSYLLDPDPIDQEFLNDLNASLPEQRPVPDYHPEYLANTSRANTVLLDDADVWVTFVHEGAGYLNVLGFYTYTVGNEPQTVADIDSVTVVFPNVSFAGSGGTLHSGDKVYLGYFPAGTEIGWVIFANGFRGTVTAGNHQLYSTPGLNPESTEEMRKHIVLLQDAARDLTVLSFEDLIRTSGSDEDFNDAIFYVTANPRTAIVTEDVVSLTYTGNDSDGDGVNDPVDSYPNDPSKAYDNYYPAENMFGSLAFEDLWPNRGDYDFNDLVVDYHFKEVLNAANQVVAIHADLHIEAVGASYENGFGFQLNLNPEDIASVSGASITGSAVTLNANGTEAGQQKAVIIPFSNAYNLVSRTDGFYFNTQPDAPYVMADTLHIEIDLVDPVDDNLLIAPPYNPFIFVNQNRVREIHLAGYPPTSLAAGSEYFDTADDYSSDVGYYRSVNHLPWAMDITETLAYPVERIAINIAHTYFVDWALASGLSYQDWYKDKPGYRVPENIYSP